MKTFIRRSILFSLVILALFAGVKASEFVGTPAVIKASAASQYQAQVSVLSRTTNSITLKWTACKGAKYYRVFMYKSNNNCVAIGDTKDTKFTVKNLKPGTNYTFVVAYAGEMVWGPQSDDFTTCTKPAKITGIKATSESTSIKLNWDRVAGATGYRIYKYNSKTKKYVSVGSVSGIREYTINKLSAGTKYKFKVRAYKDTANAKVWGDYSDVITYATKPAKVKGVKTSQTTNTLKFTWNKVSGATGYRVYKYDTKTKKYTSIGSVEGKTNFTVSKLSVGTKYKFKIRAYINTTKGAVLGSYSDVYEAATKTATPKLTVTSTAAGKATLTWKNVSGESGYQIYYSTKKDSGFKKFGETKANVTKTTINNLTGGKTYYFKVRTYIKTANLRVYSGYSTASVKIKTSVPKLTNAQATELWKEANKVHGQWFLKRYSEGFVDKSTSITYKGNIYYPIKHSTIDSMADLKKYLNNYFDDEICQPILNEHMDYNGKLYVILTGRGGFSRTFKSATVKSQSGNNAQVNLNFYDNMGQCYKTMVQKMKYDGTKWIFTEFFYMA